MSTRIETLNRKYVDPLNMSVDDLDIEAVAHALSHQCRFNGFTSRHYSVAEHSFHVSHIVQARCMAEGWTNPEAVREASLQGLLHDATEAYLIDIPRPLKSAFPEYKAIESRLNEVVCQKWGVPTTMHPYVFEADMRICVTEKLALLSPDGLERPEWADLNRNFKPYTNGEVTITTNDVHPADARRMFLARFKVLHG